MTNKMANPLEKIINKAQMTNMTIKKMSLQTL